MTAIIAQALALLIALPVAVGSAPTRIPVPDPGTPSPPPSTLTNPWAQPALPTGVWPLRPQPEVANGFDPPESRYGAGHRGVDLAGRPGQPVLAAADGRVTFAGALAGRGVVVVSHGATRTTYEPVRSEVDVGDAVTAGQVIGTLQATAGHCWPATCLHWGLLEGETYLDPLTLVGAGPVRLLPLSGVRG
jgi:murein DD-endopeptidase MepM/ murein hydrolase activator NlpD